MFVGGLDTNDQDEAGDWDGGGYIDERTGLELDMRLTKRAETEEIEFMKKICLYDVVGVPNIGKRLASLRSRPIWSG